MISDFHSDTTGWSVSFLENSRAPAGLVKSILPMTGRAILLAEFSEVFAECSTQGWSGEQSEAIGAQAYAAASLLISHLPAGIPNPSVGAIAEGLFTFEWYRNPKRLVMVVPNLNNGIDYAIRDGDELIHGSAPFFGKLPETVLSHIRQLDLP